MMTVQSVTVQVKESDMDKGLRDELLKTARENGANYGKKAELDFGAGAEWMYEKLIPNPTIDNMDSLYVELEGCTEDKQKYVGMVGWTCSRCGKSNSPLVDSCQGNCQIELRTNENGTGKGE